MTHFSFAPLTPANWPDFEQLFGPRGACGGCWCMTWRITSSAYEKSKGEGNKQAFCNIVNAGQPAGILAYVNETPVGWCAVAPREHFQRLNNSRILRKVDEQPVWSVVCFFIKKDQRGKGLSVALLKAAVQYAQSLGARIVEGYPVEPLQNPMPEVFAFTGLASVFRKAGFAEVARRSDTRPIMRIFVP